MTRMGSGSVSQGDNSSTRRIGKTNRSSKGGALYSDYYEDEPDEQPPQRSISLSALHPGPTPTLEPRMAQLETLEAKMASIEVSLSTTPRRKKPTSAATTPTPPAVNGSGAQTHPHPHPHPLTPTGTGTLGGLGRAPRDVASELELLRTTLRDKDNVIHSLKGQLCSTLSLGRLSASLLQRPTQPLTEKERRAARDRLARLRTELDSKRLAIKNIKLALERLDITDGNIDVRIQQAELEYQLGREELNLLTVLEESRGLQAALDDAASAANRESATIFHYVKGSTAVTLHAVQLVYDPKSPRFGASPRDDGSGLYVDWAAEDSGLTKGDRLLEVNGKLLSVKSREELARLLAVSPAPAQLVVMRRQAPPHLDQLMSGLRTELMVVRDRAGEAERTRDSARSDNLRLTHRISYLEEQVTDLMERLRDEGRPLSSAASSASSVKSAQAPPPSSPKPSEVQVFQKGPQVTALVANLPGLEVGSKSPVETKQKLPTVRASSRITDNGKTETKSAEKASASDTEKMHRSKKKSHLHNARSTNSLDIETSNQQKYNYSDKNKRIIDYSSETSTSERKSHQAQMEQRQRHLREARTSLFDLVEKDKLNGKLDYMPDVGYMRPNSCQPSSKHDTVSQKSLDYSSESSSRYYKKHSDPRIARPVPPKKPLRLSLHRATSLQTVEANDKKSMKRNHKGESPQYGIVWPSTIGSYRSQSSLTEKWC